MLRVTWLNGALKKYAEKAITGGYEETHASSIQHERKNVIGKEMSNSENKTPLIKNLYLTGALVVSVSVQDQSVYINNILKKDMIRNNNYIALWFVGWKRVRR